MGAHDLLQHLRGAGLSLAVDGERLTVTPRERLTDDMRESIRANKAALLQALALPESWPDPPSASYERIPEVDSDDCEPWTGQERDPQDLAHARLIGMGLDDPEAAKLAEWMALRQEHGEDQIVCYECKHFRPSRKRCGNHIQAEMPQELGADLATKPQRCPGFADLPIRFFGG
jgi:hypothetical protein